MMANGSNAPHNNNNEHAVVDKQFSSPVELGRPGQLSVPRSGSHRLTGLSLTHPPCTQYPAPSSSNSHSAEVSPRLRRGRETLRRLASKFSAGADGDGSMETTTVRRPSLRTDLMTYRRRLGYSASTPVTTPTSMFHRTTPSSSSVDESSTAAIAHNEHGRQATFALRLPPASQRKDDDKCVIL